MSRSLHDKWTRAQSEVVGVALLVGVFALLALLVGTVVIGNVTDQASNEPLAEINTSATAENLTLTHGGGDGFEETAITVILRQNGDETRYGLESFTENRGSDTARFSAGERWVRSHTLTTGLARVLVVHEPSNAVVHDEQIVVPAAPNREPVAAFEYSPEAPGANESITFNASDSYDGDGNITSYEWDFNGDGSTTTTTEPVINHTYDSGDTYNVTLTVIDDDGATNTTAETVPATVVTVVTAINAGGNDYTASDGTEYVADTSYTGGLTYATGDPIADTSDDPLYQSERYGDFSYEIPIENGEYRVTLQFAEIYWGGNGNGGGDGSRVFDTSIEGQQVLSALDIHQRVGHDRAFDVRNVTTVTDGALTIRFSTIQDNAKVSAIVVENATGPNQPPTANFTPSDTAVGVGETVQFNDTSTDFDGVVQSWQWDFDDGTTSTGRNPTHNYSQPGNYTVSLTVTDDDGATDTVSREIEVSQPPTASFTYDCTGTNCTFDASDSSDPDGTIQTYEWDWTDDGAVDQTTTTATTTHTYDQAGTYTVTLVVTDDDGVTDTVRQTVSTGGGISYGSTARGPNYDSVVEQVFTSNRNDDVTVVRAKTNETSNNLVQIDASGTRYYEVEWYDAYGLVGYGSPESGYTLPADVNLSADGVPALFEAGEYRTLYLTRFLNNGGQPVDMSGEQLRITITYEVGGRRYTASEVVTVG
ncbi:PKD domain-containing protein [Halapricum desulfuricans]|uniref:PKD domain-containing protein n=1 Tax=Halapricum desulfuricans TaxID=2841257 RepID=A0A897NS82_9EURY|nr:PKD domain-containing protein [Halapricum desulfuricans]QSG15668.1 PKD domain-containing protein [Halapricum desulfuricans]